MPVLSGSAVWMTPATSPSVIRLTAAPTLRTAAMISAWRGRSRIMAVMASGFTPLALASAKMFWSAGASRSTTFFG